MKFRVNSLDEVDEQYRDLYVKDGDTFILKLDDDPVAKALSARDHEKSRRQQAEKEARELREKAEQDQNDKNRRNGNVEEIEKAWETKFNNTTKQLSDQIAERDAQIQTMLVDNVASQLASELFTSPNLAMPHIKSRLGVEMVDGKFVTRVKDGNGALSANTIDEFKSELAQNQDFAPILKKSSATGGTGAPRQNIGTQNHSDDKPMDLSKASPKDIVKRISEREAQ